MLEALFTLFDAPPPADAKGPERVLKNLRFLAGPPGSGGTGTASGRKPAVLLTDWYVQDDAWHVTFEVTARNRPQGYDVDPALRFVGLDGRATPIAWATLEVVSGGTSQGDTVHLEGTPRGRKIKTVVRGRSVTDLPIPAAEAAVDVVITRVDEPVNVEEPS